MDVEYLNILPLEQNSKETLPSENFLMSFLFPLVSTYFFLITWKVATVKTRWVYLYYVEFFIMLFFIFYLFERYYNLGVIFEQEISDANTNAKFFSDLTIIIYLVIRFIGFFYFRESKSDNTFDLSTLVNELGSSDIKTKNAAKFKLKIGSDLIKGVRDDINVFDTSLGMK